MGKSQPNILWITLDSVRADHTSMHGYRRDTTPEIDRIASNPNGTNFEHGIAHSTRTPVSVPSMLTGLYPSRHRMIGTRSGDFVPESMETAPELLSERGYRTIGVSENGYAGAAKGLDERFDEFVRSSPSSLSDFLSCDLGVSLLKYGFNTHSHGPGFTYDVSAHGRQNSFYTTDIAKRKIKRLRKTGQPFFCYVHFNDPHHPYIPPRSHRNRYLTEVDATPEEAMNVAQGMHDDLYEWMANGIPLTDEEWEMLYAMYDATIRYVDECVGTLFDFVQDTCDETVVVITSDHGELFGEAGLVGHHIVLDDALVHVPLVTHGLEDIGICANQPTQHIDVMQTILSLVGADTTQFQGHDLRDECREIAVSQDLRGTVDDDSVRDYEKIRRHNEDVDLSHLPRSLATAARTTEFKLVRTDEWTKLYELPDETTDVSEEYPTVHDRLNEFLDDWLETKGEPFETAPEEAELSEATEQHLREMGYI